MSVIVDDSGFKPAATLIYEGANLWLENDSDLSVVDWRNVSLIAIAFPSFSDGRGFGLARALRRAGYVGHLRAVGHVISEQYAMARRVGFDDIEISDELAARQGEAQWLNRSAWQKFDYQSHLGQMKNNTNNEL